MYYHSMKVYDVGENKLVEDALFYSARIQYQALNFKEKFFGKNCRSFQISQKLRKVPFFFMFSKIFGNIPLQPPRKASALSDS